MTIKFIYPRDVSVDNIKYRRGFWFPLLTFPVLASYTPKFAEEMEIIDEEFENINFEDPVDLVAITVITSQAQRAYQIAKSFRKRGVTVALGGMHVSVLPREASQHADTVVIGEGEVVWPILLNDFKRGQLRSIYKSSTPFDMESYRPARTDLMRKYLKSEENALRKGYSTVNLFELSRGCPFDCEFCSIITHMGRQYRYRNVRKLVDEIREAKIACRSRLVGFNDDNLYGNKKLLNSLAEEIRKLNVSWFGQVSANIVKSPQLINKMADSGCKGLFVGFESLSTESIESVNKYINHVHEYRRLMELCAAHDILVFPSFIFGCDGDDTSIFQKTVDFLKAFEDNIGYCSFSVLTPLPGTRLYDRMLAEGRILEHDWKYYNFNNVVIKPKRMSAIELKSGYEWVRMQFDYDGQINSELKAMGGLSSQEITI